jgi:hypothetical protein
VIHPRRASALGLTVPLTPIVSALLGLWPLDEEEPLPVYVPPVSEGGGGGRRAQADAQRSKRIFLAKQRSILEHNQAAIATVLAVFEEMDLL